MSLSDKIFAGPISKNQFLQVEDVKEFIKEDYKNTVLAKRGEISWQEYARRRIFLLGSKLVERGNSNDN